MRILLVDDQPLVRNGMASLLQARGYDVVGEAANGREALAMVAALAPDLVLMDLRMPGMNGLEATRAMLAQDRTLKIVMLTVSDDEDDLIEAVKSGARGYLLKDLEADEFFQALENVQAGESVISQRLARVIWEEFGNASRVSQTPASAAGDELTEREWEVLRFVAEGRRNREIAVELGISENTVKYHMRRILEKLHLRNRTEATAWVAGRNLGGRST